MDDILVALICAASAALGAAWIADQRQPAGLVLLATAFMPASIVACRILAERVYAMTVAERTFLVYGHNQHGLAVTRFLAESGTGAKVIGFIDDGVGPLDNQPASVPVFRSLEEWLEMRPGFVVDGVIIAQPTASAEEIMEIRLRLRQQIPDVRLAPPELFLTGRSAMQHDPRAPHCFILGAKNFSPGARLVKRLIDLVVATIAVIVFSPVMLVAAILIKLESPGPVIFRQRRFTTDAKLFDCYKLRTMRSDPQAEGRIELTLRGDKRVTRIGAFLRRTSLDEIPQFINVLQGHMSVVGPRPHPPGVKAAGRVYEDIVADFDERYKVKPGLTGYAQVSGLRGNTFTEEDIKSRFRYDLDYINNWSLSLELWIILKTFVNGFWGKNAF